MEEALNNLSQLFPTLDRAFLEDVYVSSKKDFDSTVDQLLAMGIEVNVDKKEQAKPAVSTPPQTRPATNVSQYAGYPGITSTPPTHNSYIHQSSHFSNPNMNASPTLAPPLTPTPIINPAPLATSPPSHLINSGYQPRMDMYTPATPPPINSMNPASTSSPMTPTAPLIIKLNDSQADQKRNEAVKQELALEYQKISEKHQYNLELQKKLEQLNEFTAAEQRKLEEQRISFNEEKRKFTDELSNRFKALQDEGSRQQNEFRVQEEERIAREQERAEKQHKEKEERRAVRAQKRQESEQLRLASEEETQQRIELLTTRLGESRTTCEQLEEKNSELNGFKNSTENEMEFLKERVRNLEAQLRTATEETSAEVLSYFSTVVSTLADGIHAVSMKRANREIEGERKEGEGEREGEREDPIRELKRTFFTTVNESLNNKLREME